MDVTIVIASYGDRGWRDLAARALASVPADTPTVHVHGRTLHDARNSGLAAVQTEFVCHLDADDELTPGYLDHMAAGSADVRAPAVSYITPGRVRAPAMPRVWNHHHDCTADCLREGNWIVIGAVARTQLLRDVGGWRDFPWSEDWALWALCQRDGATFEAIPHAVYRAHVRPDSRNRAPDQADKVAAHRAIEAFVWPETAAAA